MPPTPDTLPRELRVQFGWAALFLVNTLAAGAVGLFVTDRGGRTGLFAGVGVMLAVWQFAGRWPIVRAVLLPGCVVLAVTQLYPFIQVRLGLASFWLVRAARPEREGPLTDIDTFCTTVLTGGMLWAVAGVVGCIWMAVTVLRVPRE